MLSLVGSHELLVEINWNAERNIVCEVLLTRARLLITFSHFLLLVLSGLPCQHGVRDALTPPIDAFFPALVSLSSCGGRILINFIL